MIDSEKMVRTLIEKTMPLVAERLQGLTEELGESPTDKGDEACAAYADTVVQQLLRDMTIVSVRIDVLQQQGLLPHTVLDILAHIAGEMAQSILRNAMQAAEEKTDPKFAIPTPDGVQ